MEFGEELEKMVNGTCLLNEPMSRHTSYGIGGPAGAYITPRDRDDLRRILHFADEQNIPVFFIGSGSNLLVADEGINGIVITLIKSFNKLEIKGCHIYAETGVMLGHMVKHCIKQKLTGLETMIGVPGTLGGALMMNAGAFGSEISNCLQNVDVMTLTGKIKQYSVKDIDFNYRHSSFKKDEIIMSANFVLKKATKQEIMNKRAKASAGRKETQPLRFRSAGSLFKNPKKDVAAGYLIDKAGLKGTHRGDAEISEKHANFFVNHGKANAEDIVFLIRLARKTVEKKFGINLELEVKTLGFKPGIFES
ncbi:MAG: UDP-N-acetylmuramate dehydrogenase [Candidatus Marinimicrobia bacterium]|jgi:UDP-N-acetylmuramate dehydrogenase|nr:UDP-N-acetylmuramate dehydrogenase [Candidatus Neomarinimicrobiota bacterium]MDP7336440.1 UDP-N-acetylmuramate dehydrogenase [Candidatus Neomarinimicrobiota bacterium]MDP7474576.1 UDP-N-acetylmuramate dehydrogenase [Candidatus Neomarinimicrobiota bacterium]MEE1505511.1 UDP-N-acetylmuramate dehydrogenase [Candidatus Neomarinimicrobiota bacterium]MEE1572032.1 UDP-N-acetylmuramate dehydrogenase [Candidatus Neomarinimicrobiota bacterium]|tara:strand:+ start:536 stop:1456 length:921 start_codon:yes stop_codon:yes gene_type:complete